MDFNYSEEQRMLADSLRRFIDNEYSFERRRKASRSGNGRDLQAWLTLAGMGVTGLLVPQDFGGFGEGAASLLAVQRELGRGLVCEPVTPSAVMTTAVVRAAGNAAQQARWLQALASGECIGTLAYLESHGRFDPAAIRTRAVHDGSGYVLDGRKCLVWHGEAAHFLIVSARLEGTLGQSLFVVPTADTAGLSMVAYPTMDGHRAADVLLSGVRLGPDALLGQPGEGLDALQSGLDWGTLALCAEAAGAMEKLIEITADYLRTRQQFGVPLGSFQALQHRMADMLVQKELALSMAYVAVQAMDENNPAQRQRMLAAAKHTVAKAGRYVGQQAVQLHGGMGMTDELVVGDYFKRLTMIDPLLGDSDWQLERFSAVAEL
ncbi:MAG: acyl-CoA dehydrogenase family protein [Proteobacteria bacterium]|nr:acyl-CoA dehydrogenase family protein [Pseudomonadota bacterium]